VLIDRHERAGNLAQVPGTGENAPVISTTPPGSMAPATPWMATNIVKRQRG
jgi:hypothetical protein